MENLHQSEHIPDFEHPQDAILLRENETITRMMQSQYLSPIDGIHILVDIGDDFPQSQEHIRQFFRELHIHLEVNIETILPNITSGETQKSSENQEIPENPALTQKLQHSQRAVQNVFTTLQQIQNTFNNSTNLTTAFLDGVTSIFTEDTVFQAYTNQFAFAQSS